MLTQQDEGEELDRLRESFRVARTTGLWRSPYPQSQWSALLGVTVRESCPDDPGLTIAVRAPTRPSVHASGFAVSGPCSVWSR